MKTTDKIIKKIKDEFSHLNFIDHTHEYYLDNKKLPSVSSYLKNYKRPFNVAGASYGVAKRDNRTVESVREEWQKKSLDACILGTKVHSFGEKFFHDRNTNPDLGYEIAIINYWDSLPKTEIPLLCETKVFSKEYGFGGTFDLLFYDKKRKGLIIKDYKTNNNLFKNYKNEKLLSPFDDLLSNNYNIYSLQLSMYQIPLEEIGLTISERRIIHLKEDGAFEVFSTEDYTTRLKENINGK